MDKNKIFNTYTVADVATILNKSTRTIRRWIAIGYVDIFARHPHKNNKGQILISQNGLKRLASRMANYKQYENTQK